MVRNLFGKSSLLHINVSELLSCILYLIYCMHPVLHTCNHGRGVEVGKQHNVQCCIFCSLVIFYIIASQHSTYCRMFESSPNHQSDQHTLLYRPLHNSIHHHRSHPFDPRVCIGLQTVQQTMIKHTSFQLSVSCRPFFT